MKKLKNRYDILIAIVFFLIAIPAEYGEWFSTLENQTLSFRHIIRTSYGDPEKTTFPRDKIGIVFMDERFFKEYGSFPLRRTDIGKIVENLQILGAKVTLVDMLMDFPSSYREDPVIAESLRKAGNSVLVSMIEFNNKGEFVKINYPTKTIKEGTRTAYSNHLGSGDKMNRLRLYPEIIEKTGEWPAAVMSAAVYLGIEPQIIKNILLLGERQVKLDQFGDFRNDFPAMGEYKFLTQDPFVGISAMDILQLDREDEDEIEELSSLISGKIILFGDTSEVSHDIFDTIVGEVYGVEIIAIEVATLLGTGNLRSASVLAEIVILLIFAILLLFLQFIPEPVFRFSGTAALLIVYFVFGTVMYTYLDVVFSMSYLISASVLGFASINIFLFIQEKKEKSFITNAFGQYLSPAVIETLVGDPSKLSLGGERREMTAYFSDVQGFSTISEGLTPDELVELLNLYLTEMCNIISDYNGTVDKFEGDAIIAFWGAPLIQLDHATLCCHASIDMQKRMVEMRKELLAAGRPQLLVRMGINSGPMVVGNMGSAHRMDYTMMGDAVNLAARLEGANKFYKNFSMISGSTYEQAKDHIDVREMDVIRVVGKNEPVPVFDLLDKKNQVSGKLADMVEVYNKGLALYKDLNFKEAIPVFESALKIIPTDGLCLTYVDRCKNFLVNPPASDWDRVFTLTEKG